jgi:hypothetical protein
MLIPPVGGFRGKLGGTMKKQVVRILLGILFIGFILALPAGQAFASLANTSISLNLSGLINILGSLTGTTGTDATISNSLGEMKDLSDLKPGWASSLSNATISNAAAHGESIAGQSLFTTSYTNLNGTGWSSSSGNAILTGSFTFTAPVSAWVMVFVPYSITMDLTASNGPLASAYGKTKASISLAKSGGSTSTDFIELFSTVYDGNTYVENKSGDNYKLAVMKWFVAGETGTFTAEVFTETATSNPVPLPGALWLFAPGLACFVGLRRRLNK